MIPKSLLHHGIGGKFVVIIQKTKILLAPNRKKGFVSELKGCFGWDRGVTILGKRLQCALFLTLRNFATFQL